MIEGEEAFKGSVRRADERGAILDAEAGTGPNDERTKPAADIIWSREQPAARLSELMDGFLPDWRACRDDLNQAPLRDETWSLK